MTDPVILPEHEHKIAAAAATGDNAKVALAQKRYNEAREEHEKEVQEGRDILAQEDDDDEDGDS